jgi:periplasmic divalent cation tolerance protein
MRAIYRWEGNVVQDTETVLIAKTVEEKVAALTERVKALHSYDCPCVVALPVTGGHRVYQLGGRGGPMKDAVERIAGMVLA